MNYQTASPEEKQRITRWIKRNAPELAQLIKELKPMGAELIEIVKKDEKLREY